MDRVIACQGSRHAVAHDPASSRARVQHFEQASRIEAGTQRDAHRLGAGSEIHSGELVVEDLVGCGITGLFAKHEALRRDRGE